MRFVFVAIQKKETIVMRLAEKDKNTMILYAHFITTAKKKRRRAVTKK